MLKLSHPMLVRDITIPIWFVALDTLLDVIIGVGIGYLIWG